MSGPVLECFLLWPHSFFGQQIYSEDRKCLFWYFLMDWFGILHWLNSFNLKNCHQLSLENDVSLNGTFNWVQFRYIRQWVIVVFTFHFKTKHVNALALLHIRHTWVFSVFPCTFLAASWGIIVYFECLFRSFFSYISLKYVLHFNRKINVM